MSFVWVEYIESEIWFWGDWKWKQKFPEVVGVMLEVFCFWWKRLLYFWLQFRIFLFKIFKTNKGPIYTICFSFIWCRFSLHFFSSLNRYYVWHLVLKYMYSSKKRSLSDFLSNQYLFTNICFVVFSHQIIQHFSHVRSWLVLGSVRCQLEFLQFLGCQLLAWWTNCSLPLGLLFFSFYWKCISFALIMRGQVIASYTLPVYIFIVGLTIAIAFLL